MASPFPTITSPPQAGAEVIVNQLGEAVEHVAVYAKAYLTTTGLIWGYYGGRWGGFPITAGTLTLTDASTNYVVVAVATGVVSTSATNTNWNNATDYARAYKLTTAGGVVTAIEDHRGGPGGIYGGAGGGGGGGGSASSVSVTDAGGYYTGSDVEAILQEIGASIAGGGGGGSVGTPVVITHTLTRPANTTAYTAGKVMADATSSATMRTFTNVASANGKGFRLNRMVWVDSATSVSGSDTYDFFLHLFNGTVGTIPNDGANMDFTFADLGKLVASIPMLFQTTLFSANVTAGEGVGATGKRMGFVENLDQLIVCDPGSRNLYGVIEVLHGWTPVSGEQFSISLFGEQVG